MNIALIGASGFIGSALLEELYNADIRSPLSSAHQKS